MEIKPQVTIVIFTNDRYIDLLPTVIEGTKNIQDEIVGRYIVSPDKIDVPGYISVTDDYIWSLFDPNFKYKKLYDRNWYRQQILKLNIDKIEGASDNILIIDGDVVVTKPMRFIENNKVNYYMAGEYYLTFFNFNRNLMAIKKVHPCSFISETMVFNRQLLESLREYITNHNNGEEWLSVIERLLAKSLSTSATFANALVMSEYEIYGSYVTARHRNTVNRYIDPYPTIEHQQRLDIHGWQDKSPEELYEMIAMKNPHFMQAVLLR